MADSAEFSSRVWLTPSWLASCQTITSSKQLMPVAGSINTVAREKLVQNRRAIHSLS